MKILLRIAVVAVTGALIAGCCNCREGNRLTAVGTCNRLSGIYKTDDKRSLKLGPIASTMMACPGMEREHAFAQALEATTHYDMDGPMLLLLSNGELKAVFQAKP